ncbi:hypothetical protein [Thiomicrorhabdus sediminis]|uniref:Uncharacterized protein n=1 Tax=Thiomicrorhabdus sediminis TaxID=2580412 RepID=A0A4P9K778_9GAMM|nr:hypothetical protein [Thiomicrorhabdus sediminis]QCU90751.1 hypothetical protein FE785_08985 [Thiomicrorhabdus sediminis]
MTDSITHDCPQNAPDKALQSMLHAINPKQQHQPFSEIELSAYQFWKTQSRLAKLTMQLQHSLHQQRLDSKNS